MRKASIVRTNSSIGFYKVSILAFYPDLDLRISTQMRGPFVLTLKKKP